MWQASGRVGWGGDRGLCGCRWRVEGIGGGSSSFVEDAPTLGSKANGAMGGGVSRPKAVDAEQTQAKGHGGTAGQSPPQCVSGIDMHRKEGVE